MIAGVQFTDRFAPNSLPGIPVGDKVQVYAFIQSDDPPGSPAISVAAIQGGTNFTLDFSLSTLLLYPGQHVYSKFINLDQGLLGPWKITPSDSTGIGLSDFTNAIAEPEFVPVVEGIIVGGTPVGASVSWTLPNLDGFDIDAIRLRIIEAATGVQVFQSEDLVVQTLNFEPPADALKVGVDYVYRISLNDYDGGYFENRSNAFSHPFRYAAPGDFTGDGAVDAGDLNQWKGDFGVNGDSDADNDGDSDGADFLAWQRQLGAAAAGVQSSSTVPEPAGVTLAMALVVVLARPSRTLAATRLPLRGW